MYSMWKIMCFFNLKPHCITPNKVIFHMTPLMTVYLLNKNVFFYLSK